VIEPHSHTSTLSTLANLLILVLSFVLAPYIFFTGSFWGAPIWELGLQIAFACVLPIAAMPLSAVKAERLLQVGKTTKAAQVRFLPTLLFFIVGPAALLAIGTMARLVHQ
jgi:hypothetical protein